MAGSIRHLGRVQGLVFDMGDVLYDATAWRRWLVQLLHRMGLHTHYRCFYRLWERDYLHDVHCGRRSYRDAFRAFLRSAGLSSGQIDEVEAASQARKRALESNARPLPGVRSTLERLAASGLALGVLSDSESPAEELRARLGRLGLEGRFSTVVSSIDLGRAKPDPFCYRSALEELQLSADQAAFVGHDAEELAGAQAVGLWTVAFNYDPDAVADCYLERFEELAALADARPAICGAYLGAA